MAEVAIGSGVDDGLAGMDGDLVGEKFAQDGHGVEAEGEAGKHEEDAGEEDCSAMRKDGALRKLKCQGKGRSQREPEKNHEQGEGVAVAAGGAVGGALAYGGDGFQRDPQRVDGPENGGVEGSAGKRQWVQGWLRREKHA